MVFRSSLQVEDVYKRQGYYDAYYLKALRTKALIKQAFDKAFAKYDMRCV